MKVLCLLLIQSVISFVGQSQSVDPLLTEDMVAALPLIKQPKVPCKSQFPLYSDTDGKPIWLDSKQLKSRSIHCEAPKSPSMSKISVEGTAKLSMLVNPAGTVDCIRVVAGHPFITDSAIEAAKNWQFRPVIRNGKQLAFYGLLEFHITTGKSDHEPDPCLCGHWK
jgi:TonB family protein